MTTRTDTAAPQGAEAATRELTAFTDVRLIAGNSAAWHARRTLIAQARQTLDLCYFIVETDASSAALVLDLLAAARRGVKVRVLVDYLMTYPHAPLLRGLAGGDATIEVRRFGAPSAEWLQALTRGGIDARRFVEGLATQNTALLLESISAVVALPKSIAVNLRNALHRYEQGAQVFVLRVFEIFQEARSKLGEMLESTTHSAARGDPSVAGLLEGLRAKVDDVRRGVALAVEIIRGLEAVLHRTHHKLLLADGHSFIMGGRNLADAYQCDAPDSGRPFRDVDLQAVEVGESASAHTEAFEALWRLACAEPLDAVSALDAGGSALDADQIEVLARKLDQAAAAGLPGDVHPLPDMAGYIVNNLPGKAGDASITHAYTERILVVIGAATRQTIDIVSAYAYFQDQTSGRPSLRGVRDALAAAARAGHTVNIYTNSIDSTDLKSVNAAAYRTFADLIDCGVHVHELAPGQGSLHAKVAAIGDDWLMVGSFNMDPRSELYDTNNLIVLQDANGAGTAVLREGFILKLTWTPLSAQAARQLAEDRRQLAISLSGADRIL